MNTDFIVKLRKVTSSKLDEKTGFFFSKDGYILSCGHGVNIGETWDYSFSYQKKLYSAVCIESKYDISLGVDYSIFKSGEAEHFHLADTCELRTDFAGFLGHSIELYGFHRVSLVLWGRADGLIRDGNLFRCRIDENVELGMSGGPALVRGKKNKALILGVQSHRLTDHHSHSIISPISAIEKHSELIKRHFVRKNFKSIHNSRGIAQALKVNRYKLDCRKSVGFILSDQRTSDASREIRNLIEQKYRSVLMSHFEGTHTTSETAHRLDTCREITPNKKWSDIDFFCKQLNGSQLKFLINCTNEDGICTVGSCDQIHLSLIQQSETDSSSANKPFNLEVHTDIVNEAKQVKAAHFGLDSVLDCAYFYNSNLLKLFANLNYQAFLNLKIRFARKKSLLVYGAPIHQDAKYVSFASCCRSTLADELNFKFYSKLWDEFIAELTNSIDSKYIPLSQTSCNELKSMLKSSSCKYKGQLGKRHFNRLDKQYNKKCSSEEDLYALIICSKSPGKQVQKQIDTLFEKNNTSKNDINIIASNDFSKLLTHAEHVDYTIFRV